MRAKLAPFLLPALPHQGPAKVNRWKRQHGPSLQLMSLTAETEHVVLPWVEIAPGDWILTIADPTGGLSPALPWPSCDRPTSEGTAALIDAHGWTVIEQHADGMPALVVADPHPWQ